MDADHYVALVLAFLDQFIDRGADSQLSALRDGLRDDPQMVRFLVDGMPSRDVSPREGFAAMRRFVEQAWRQLPSPGVSSADPAG